MLADLGYVGGVAVIIGAFVVLLILSGHKPR